MKTTIALFRGINVGGKNSLPMQGLKTLLQNIGLANIRTYIQSGNVVFEGEDVNSTTLMSQIEAAVRANYGFEPKVMLLEPEELEAAIARNPFPESTEGLHLGFLAETPVNPDLTQLERFKKDSEQFQLIDKVFYLNAPEGIGRSKLAANAERLLGVPMTDRNWRTVCKIRDMV